jgi:polyisoprenoid-binding protein YceI
MAAPVRMRHWKRWLGIGVAVAAIAVVGGPFLYIHFVASSAPAPLTLSSPSATPSATGTTSSSTASVAADGTWNIATGSIVGYRVDEVLFGQSHAAVGRTSSISGSMVVGGTTVSQASFTVDMTSVTSDQSRRDAQFNGRIMDTSTYATATFTLTKPIDLGSIPANGVQRTFKATGTLTLHGVTKTVSFTVTGQYAGSVVQVAGSIPITFADWSIPNPSFGGVVTTDDHGVLEFALNFAHA